MAVTSGNLALQKLLSTPTGQKLYQECQQKGVKIQFAQNNGDNTMGQYDPNSNTITVENASLEQMVEVLAHEMLHASTKENGNSKNEEIQAFLIGEKVATEAGVNANPHDQAFYTQHVNKAYSGLKQDNGIAAAVQALGLATDQANNAINTYNANKVNNAQNPFNTVNNANAANTNINNTANTDQLQNLNQNGANQGLVQFITQIIAMIMGLLGDKGNEILNPQTNNNNLIGNNQVTQQSLAPILSFQA